jgi:acyl-coenzyme A thioesterase 13
MVVDEIGEGVAVCRLPVDRSLANAHGTAHGGLTATLVDVMGTLAILSQDPQRRAGVSVDINVSYVSPCKLGDTLVCTGRVVRTGRTLAFTQVDIARLSDGRVVATGRHTKYL